MTNIAPPAPLEGSSGQPTWETVTDGVAAYPFLAAGFTEPIVGSCTSRTKPRTSPTWTPVRSDSARCYGVGRHGSIKPAGGVREQHAGVLGPADWGASRDEAPL